MESYLRRELKEKHFLVALFVCLLSFPRARSKTICMEHDFSEAENITTLISRVKWSILIRNGEIKRNKQASSGTFLSSTLHKDSNIRWA